ncbi:MAG: hypothetical protein RLZZ577_36 [Bacteroidota bacterium]|jgi:hypothetical protein
MEQLKQLNQFRLDAERNFQELNHIRDRHMNSLGRVDSKLDEYHNIIIALRTEMRLIITNNEINISVEVFNLFDADDNQVLMAKIDIPEFPTIYKTFFGISYSLFQIYRSDTMNDFSIQGRIKELALEWLIEKEEYAGLFNQPWKNSEGIVDRFLNNEAVFHYLKRRPIML